jgi:cell wall-associated NlpC family hydrolase
MQLAEVGERAVVGNDHSGLARGDLVFWPGHVGIMLDPVRLLHANAHHMAVAVEPLRDAAQRIARTGQTIAAVKRLPPQPG